MLVSLNSSRKCSCLLKEQDSTVPIVIKKEDTFSPSSKTFNKRKSSFLNQKLFTKSILISFQLGSKVVKPRVPSFAQRWQKIQALVDEYEPKIANAKSEEEKKHLHQEARKRIHSIIALRKSLQTKVILKYKGKDGRPYGYEKLNEGIHKAFVRAFSKIKMDDVPEEGVFLDSLWNITT